MQLLSRARAALLLLLWTAMGLAHGANPNSYSWPADLTTKFGCTLTSPGVYRCPSINITKNSTIYVTSPITVNVIGNVNVFMFTIPSGQKDLLLTATGYVYIEKNSTATFDVDAVGDITIGMNSKIYGDLKSGDDINVGKNTTIYGDVFANDALYVDPDHGSITGSCSYATTNYICSGGNNTNTAFDHFMLEHEGSGLTCTPSDVIVYACSSASSGGECTTTTAGASGTLTVKNGSTVLASYPFTIPSGSGYTTVEVSYPGTATVTLDTSTSDTTCWNGTSASCSHTFADSGFIFSIPNHRSGAEQTVSISAVKKSDSSNVCVPAFNTSKSVNFLCSYVSPTTGSKQLSITSGSTTTPFNCGYSTPVSLAFDSEGTASFKMTYPDAGKLNLSASYPSAGMTGSDEFTAVPANYLVETVGPYVAGTGFTVKVTARNTANVATPNYANGASATSLSFTRCQPSGSSGSDGNFSGALPAFTGGVAQTTTATWSEVGTMDVTATTSDYLSLGASFPITGSTNSAAFGCSGAGGPFKPHHFDTELTAHPTSGAAPTFAYSGQPVAVKVYARNANNLTTSNYYTTSTSASFARKVTLSARNSADTADNPGPGAMSENEIAAATFITGADSGSASGAPVYTFTVDKTAPTTIRFRATDTDGVTSSAGIEATLPIRRGRLRMSNAFGTSAANLVMSARTEYWTGSSWLLNTDDDYTLLPAASFALSPKTGLTGVSVLAAAQFTDGKATFTLKKPDSNGVGYVDIAANLGATATDTSCLSAHPPSTAANHSWLRALNGSCNTNWTQDPAARANFGITSPENKATIHVRESFN